MNNINNMQAKATLVKFERKRGSRRGMAVYFSMFFLLVSLSVLSNNEKKGDSL